MTVKSVLLTGFEPYGGRSLNPSREIATRLDGTQLGSARISGRVLPVSFDTLQQHVDALLAEFDPGLIISLGLYPGTPVIRLERIGINVADCALADNDGQIYCDHALAAPGPDALLSTLPLRAIEQRLLDAGIPVTLSNSAGTYLCNAVLYRFLRALRAGNRDSEPPCGFIHLPYLPAQVAQLLSAGKQDGTAVGELASMDLASQTEAVRLAIAACLEAGSGAGT